MAPCELDLADLYDLEEAPVRRLVKLVLLPYESHGYEARESVEHVLAEQFEWFDKYVKGEKK